MPLIKILDIIPFLWYNAVNIINKALMKSAKPKTYAKERTSVTAERRLHVGQKPFASEHAG